MPVAVDDAVDAALKAPWLVGMSKYACRTGPGMLPLTGVGGFFHVCFKSVFVLVIPYAGYAEHGFTEPDDNYLIEIWASTKAAPQGGWAFVAEGASLWIPYASKVFATTFEDNAV
eukprot:12255998-Alexandrium_andersonii.AAC.1